MRWEKPKNHSKRIVKAFAFLPVTLYDHSETRWLEICYIEQAYCDWGTGLMGWKNIRFRSRKEYENND